MNVFCRLYKQFPLSKDYNNLNNLGGPDLINWKAWRGEVMLPWGRSNSKSWIYLHLLSKSFQLTLPESLPLWILYLTSQPLQSHKPIPRSKFHVYPTFFPPSGGTLTLRHLVYRNRDDFWILTHIFTISSFFRWYGSNPNEMNIKLW